MPIQLLLGLAILPVLLVAVILSTRRSRARGEARLRADWGHSIDRWRDLEGIAEYHRYKALDSPSAEFLDERTWDDLHMDLVFSEIDATRSSVGAQLLYHRLRSAPPPEERDRFERLVGHFEAHDEERLAAQRLLSRVSNTAGHRLWSLCEKGALETKWWFWLFPFLTVAVAVSAPAILIWPRAFFVLVAILFLNILLRLKVASRVFPLLEPFREVGPLLKCANVVLATSTVSEILGPQVKRRLSSVMPLRRSARWASRNASVNSELVGSMFEYLNLLFLVDANAVLLASRALKSRGQDLLAVIEWLGGVDAAISTASLRAGRGPWAIPVFTESESRVKLTGVWHPLLEDAIPNSIQLTLGRGLIITGSNMSGKSTFLRTVGVSVVLAQTLNTCPAEAYSGPPLRVRSAIGRSDDLTAGKSYYLVEVEAVLDLLRSREADTAHLFLFDELFRGTNTIERLAAGEAVLKALPLDEDGESRHVVIAATHDAELVQMLDERYDPYSFVETIREDGLAFDYKIHRGPARTRSAIALLEISGAPPSIVARARLRAAQLDAEAAAGQASDLDSRAGPR